MTNNDTPTQVGELQLSLSQAQMIIRQQKDAIELLQFERDEYRQRMREWRKHAMSADCELANLTPPEAVQP